jgi:two-component system response regulator PilR (NtrC family)
MVGLDEIKKQARRLALQEVNLLIIGESGTGKELLASAIHNASPRTGKRFVIVNCAAMPETLFESELFGHKKGAFTGAHSDKIGKIEYADKGTLFFDEVGELSLDIQAKLLRVLEDKKVIPLGSNEARVVDVRFIFATNKNLESLVEQGKFREDLYYRISSPMVRIPPLRERKEEIPALINHLFLKIKSKHKGFVGGLTEQAKKALMEYDYPGNVRELEKMLEQAFLLCDKENIDIDALRLKEIKPFSIEEKVRQHKAKLIYECFLINGRDIKKTCKELKLSERQIYRYLKEIKANKNY